MAILERMSVEFGVVAKAIERLAPHPFPRLRCLFAGLRSMIFAGHRQPGLVTTLGRQILKSNGLASPYSQAQMEILNQDDPA
jgi:hypothetical protein